MMPHWAWALFALLLRYWTQEAWWSKLFVPPSADVVSNRRGTRRE